MRLGEVVPFTTGPEVEAAIPVVVDHLKQGGLIAYPTETVYGLGGVTTSQAVESLTMLKPRSADSAFLVLVSGQAMIDNLQLQWNPPARALARRFWPGPLTLILAAPATPLPAQLVGPDGGVALRWTAHNGISRLVELLGGPLTSTSANTPGSPPAMSAASVVSYFRNELRAGSLMVLDGGVLPASPPSTLVDCTRNPPGIIRHGAVDAAALAAMLPDPSSDALEP